MNVFVGTVFLQRLCVCVFFSVRLCKRQDMVPPFQDKRKREKRVNTLTALTTIATFSLHGTNHGRIMKMLPG